MEDTSCGDNCPFVKNGSCKDCSGCPNYIESWWTQQGATHPKLVKDCSPKRIMLQQQYLQLRVEQLTAEIQEARTQYLQVAHHLSEIIKLSKIDPKNQVKELDYENSDVMLSMPPVATVLQSDI